jgi:hypothetical protein
MESALAAEAARGRHFEAQAEVLTDALVEASDVCAELARVKDEMERMRASHALQLADVEARGAAAVQARVAGTLAALHMSSSPRLTWLSRRIEQIASPSFGCKLILQSCRCPSYTVELTGIFADTKARRNFAIRKYLTQDPSRRPHRQSWPPRRLPALRQSGRWTA